jgi:DNA-binding response OmpR family regulator
MRVLIVDDDESIRAGWSESLANDLVKAVFVPGLSEAKAELDRNGAFDAIVLDVSWPAALGLRFLRDLRTEGRQTPVIVTSTDESINERVRALELGADDCVTKPFEMRELLARLRAVLRRNLRTESLSVGEFEVDVLRRRVAIRGGDLELSPREFDLLWLLLQAGGRAVSRDELHRRWTTNGDRIGSNVVVVHVSRLRRKLASRGDSRIETVRGEGYRLLA